jgi:hypothetical protein
MAANEALVEAITRAVLYAIEIVGIEGLRATSMFPSSHRAGFGDMDGGSGF